MAHRQQWLLTPFLLILAAPACAGFAQVSPPSGWQASSSGATYRTTPGAANESAFSGGFRGAPGTMNAGGAALTKVPASYRFAANAPRMFARFAFGNPLMFGASLALPIAYQWFRDNQFEVVAGVWNKRVPGDFYCPSVGPATPMPTGYQSAEWKCVYAATNADGVSVAGSASTWGWCLKGSYSWASGNCFNSNNAYGSGYFQPVYSTHRVISQKMIPATAQMFEDDMALSPLPDGIAQENAFDWPVEKPILNPGLGLMPGPLRVPQGSPWPQPNSSPQTWTQRVIDIKTDVNTVDNPWLVELEPKEVTVATPEGITEPEPVKPTDPTGTTPENPDLCLKYPDILACAKYKLGELQATPLPNKTVNVSIQQDAGWNTGSGTCPAPRTFTVLGKSMSFSFQLLCDFAQAVRPLFIGFAWLTATLTFFGLSRKD